MAYRACRIRDAAGTWTHPLQDALGSVRAEMSNPWIVSGTQTFDPMGNPIGMQGHLVSPFAFTGELRDPNGLNYHRARYDPSIGIWTALDPFEGVVDQPRCWHQSRLL